MPECRKVFFWHLFGVSVLLFCITQPQMDICCIFRGFLSILFPQKACLKLFLFFLFCFFLFLSSLSKIHFLLFVHQPLFRKKEELFVGFILFFFCLPLPFLMFACLFETNFPNIPFLKPKLLSFLAIYFFFCCSCFVCFSLSVSVGFVFGIFWLLFCVFVFVLFLVCFQSMKNCFPCNSGVS